VIFAKESRDAERPFLGDFDALREAAKVITSGTTDVVDGLSFLAGAPEHAKRWPTYGAVTAS
jgi:hypothetical protein